jgi:hypothetical protein
MRLVIVLTAALGLMSAVSARPALDAMAPTGSAVAMAHQPDFPDDVDIDINTGGESGGFWASPTWIAIGVIGIVLLVVIVAMISRGGGTTVIRE